MAALTDTEIQTQWKNAVDILEKTRAFIDGTLFDEDAEFDVLTQSARGDFLPDMILRFQQTYRSAMSGLISPAMVQEVLSPVLYEYAGIIDAATAGATGSGYGSGYSQPRDLMKALYEYFAGLGTPDTIETRAITFDTSATTANLSTNSGNIVGNGALGRLTVDENGYPLESCHVERKQFRCRSDANSNAQKEAEVFEVVGESSSPDHIGIGSHGSGDAARRTIVSKNCGTSGDGGSLLSNSTFSTYAASSTPKFANWTETNGGAQVSQDTTNYYRTHPGAPLATPGASLKITGGSGQVTLTQPITPDANGSAMRIRRIDPDTPYFLRCMVNPTIGSASGGTFKMSLGSVDVSETIADLVSTGGWQEMVVPFDTSCWPRNFNEAGLAVVLDWSSSTSGYLLVDDIILSPWDLIDGTYWCIRGNAASHTAWALDDLLEVTDTGGAPGTGKLQYWLWRGGYGHLPSSGTPTIADP